MGKLIIVEGIDRVGKTTLCNKLSNELNIPIFKDNCQDGVYNDKRVNYEKMNTIVNMFEQLEMQDFISDRFHLTELVYGILDRRYVNTDIMEILEKRLAKLDVLLILVKPTSISRSSREHGSELKHHAELFELFYGYSNLNKICCSYETIDDAVERSKKWICTK